MDCKYLSRVLLRGGTGSRGKTVGGLTPTPGLVDGSGLEAGGSRVTLPLVGSEGGVRGDIMCPSCSEERGRAPVGDGGSSPPKYLVKCCLWGYPGGGRVRQRTQGHATLKTPVEPRKHPPTLNLGRVPAKNIPHIVVRARQMTTRTENRLGSHRMTNWKRNVTEYISATICITT